MGVRYPILSVRTTLIVPGYPIQLRDPSWPSHCKVDGHPDRAPIGTLIPFNGLSMYIHGDTTGLDTEVPCIVADQGHSSSQSFVTRRSGYRTAFTLLFCPGFDTRDILPLGPAIGRKVSHPRDSPPEVWGPGPPPPWASPRRFALPSAR